MADVYKTGPDAIRNAKNGTNLPAMRPGVAHAKAKAAAARKRALPGKGVGNYYDKNKYARMR